MHARRRPRVGAQLRHPGAVRPIRCQTPTSRHCRSAAHAPSTGSSRASPKTLKVEVVTNSSTTTTRLRLEITRPALGPTGAAGAAAARRPRPRDRARRRARHARLSARPTTWTRGCSTTTTTSCATCARWAPSSRGQFPKIAAGSAWRASRSPTPTSSACSRAAPSSRHASSSSIDAEFPRFTQRLLEIVYPHFLRRRRRCWWRTCVRPSDPNLRAGFAAAARHGAARPLGKAGADGVRVPHRARGDAVAARAHLEASTSSTPADLPLSGLPLPNRAGAAGAAPAPAQLPRGHRRSTQLALTRCASSRRAPTTSPAAVRARCRPRASASCAGATRPRRPMASRHSCRRPRRSRSASATTRRCCRTTRAASRATGCCTSTSRSRSASCSSPSTGCGGAARRRRRRVRHRAPARRATCRLSSGSSTPSNFALYCTPAINLFERRSDRIHVDAGRATSITSCSTARAPLDFEVYSITEVLGHGAEATSEPQRSGRSTARPRRRPRLRPLLLDAARAAAAVGKARSATGRARATSAAKSSSRWSTRRSAVPRRPAPARRARPVHQPRPAAADAARRRAPTSRWSPRRRSRASRPARAVAAAFRRCARAEITWRLISHLVAQLPLADRPRRRAGRGGAAAICSSSTRRAPTPARSARSRACARSALQPVTRRLPRRARSCSAAASRSSVDARRARVRRRAARSCSAACSNRSSRATSGSTPSPKTRAPLAAARRDRALGRRGRASGPCCERRRDCPQATRATEAPRSPARGRSRPSARRHRRASPTATTSGTCCAGSMRRTRPAAPRPAPPAGRRAAAHRARSRRSPSRPRSCTRSSSAPQRPPPRLRILGFGLFGPNGPLPIHLTEYARERAAPPRRRDVRALRRHAPPPLHAALLSRLGGGAADGQPRPAGRRPLQPLRRRAHPPRRAQSARQRDAVADHAKLVLRRPARRARRATPKAWSACCRGYFGAAGARRAVVVGHWLRAGARAADAPRRAPRSPTQLGAGAVLGATVCGRAAQVPHPRRPAVARRIRVASAGRQRPSRSCSRWCATTSASSSRWDVRLVLRATKCRARASAARAPRLDHVARHRRRDDDADDLVLVHETIVARQSLIA